MIADERQVRMAARLYEMRDTARRLPLRELWRLMGATSWATYAAQLPQVWQAPLLDHAAAVAKDFQAGRVGLVWPSVMLVISEAAAAKLAAVQLAAGAAAPENSARK